MIKASVIMPIYNMKKYLERAVESVLNQTYQNFEIILVDDGSTDGCEKLCDEYAKKRNNISVIHQENQGVSQARNSGMRRAKGKYIYFMDPDDYIDSNLLEENCRIADETNVDIVMFNYIREFYNEKGECLSKKEGAVSIEGYYDNEHIKESFIHFINESCPYAYFVWNKIYRREFLEKNDMHFTSIPYGEDSCFNFEIYSGEYNSYYNKKVYYHYCARGDSIINRYNPDRCVYELMLAAKVKEMAAKLGKSESQEYIELIGKYYYRAINFELHNLKHAMCLYSKKEKIARIAKIMEKEDVKEQIYSNIILKKADKRNKIKIILLRMHMYKWALAITGM